MMRGQKNTSRSYGFAKVTTTLSLTLLGIRHDSATERLNERDSREKIQWRGQHRSRREVIRKQDKRLTKQPEMVPPALPTIPSLLTINNKHQATREYPSGWRGRLICCGI